MVAQNTHVCPTDRLVAELASLWGVSTAYRDAAGHRREPPREAVIEVLGALGGSSLRDERGLREALKARKAQLRERLVEPVLVAWEGLLPRTALQGLRTTVVLESGDELAVASGTRIPFGRYGLRVESGRRVREVTVISAPRRCWKVEAGPADWGVFAPTYALRSERDWGAGDLAEVESLLRTVSEVGGKAVATLPLLAVYLDRPFEPGPYTPVSRLFWNEFYVAVEQIPEWADCAPARAVWGSGEFQEKVARLRARLFVDYAGVMALKRRVLEELCRHYFREGGSRRRAALEAFLAEGPEVLAYADFRAKVEAQGCDWRAWPAQAQPSERPPTTVDQLSEAGRYHLYTQWQLHEQLARMSGLVLDLPVGIHPGGFDVWSRRDQFVTGMAIGAPPDAFFTHGQCWDSPPLHPERIRDQGLSYWEQVLRHHMRFATWLRIDHVMSLHRLFWIPAGRGPDQGVYVDYPTDELYAVLCLESFKTQTLVTGEDLGTVPPGVRSRMRRHNVLGTWVLQGAVRPRSARVVAPVPPNVVAALGTHDMFPLAGFLKGDDIRERVQTRQLDENGARRALAARRRLIAKLSSFLAGSADENDPAKVLAGALSYLAASQAALVLVALDDLLLQEHPQNIPGTGADRENWRRKLSGGRDEIERVISCAVPLLTRGQSMKYESS
jgi:4-alpha-glucanotransferase